MTDKQKAVNKEINYFERWCDKKNYDYCLTWSHECIECIKYYFAEKVVKLRKRVK
jgi:hypothetical protein